MKNIFQGLLLIFLISFAPQFVTAQVPTGTPPFTSSAGGPDILDLANLNVHISIPVLHKPGRGTSFTYDLSYDTSVWYPVGSSGSQTWQYVNNWGWRGQTEVATGYVSYTHTTITCPNPEYPPTPPPTLRDILYSNFVYHDAFGVSHPYNFTFDPGVCEGDTSAGGITTDGSGFKLTVTWPSGALVFTVNSPSGATITPPGGIASGSATAIDRNGNEITADSSGHFYDTLSSSAAALTVAGSGTPSSPLTFTYPPPTGSPVTYTMKYTNYTVQTAFGCSGIAEFGPTTEALVSEIDLPDGSKYTFNYEVTHNDSHNPHFVTGRLSSVTFPTGGAVIYAYAIGGSGVNGISCADGSASTLVRTTPDGQWTYGQAKGTGAASTTTVTDPLGNDTVIQFQGIYETQRQNYNGSHTSGTLLQTVSTCYNGASFPCTGTAITAQITQRAVIGNLPGSGNKESEHIDKWNSYGMPTETDDYDYGSGAPGSLLKKTLITYASLGGYLNAFAQTVKVQDGSGAVKYRQDSSYDQYSGFTGSMCITGAPQHNSTYGCSFTARANLTAVTTYTDPVTPAGGITKNFTYDSLGNIRTAQINCCQLKTWNYSTTTGYAYPDSIVSGSSSPQLTTSYTYDLNMGQVLTSTDPNNLKTTYTYDYFARPLTVQVGTNPSITYSYTDSGTWSAKVCAPVSNSNTVCQNTILDSQGRPVTAQTLDGSSTLYSATDTHYDSLGRADKTSNPYTSTPQYWTATGFDALGRVTSTTLPDNSQTGYSYTDNTVTVTDPTSKQRILQYDALGRLVNVTEPDPNNSNSLTLQTSYTYTVLDALNSVTQGSQTRTYNYDALGRLLSTVTPEGGTTCFGSVSGSTCNADGYDSFNNLLKRTDARGVVTTYGYDGLNRLTSIAYNVSGATGVPATPTVSLTYDQGGAAAYALGHLTYMSDGVGSETYTYNSLEQMSELQKVIGTTTYTTQYSFNYAGEVTQITYPSGRVVAQNYDVIGRSCSVGASGSTCTSGTLYASGFGYNPAMQVTGFQYGNGIYASYGFSADRLQLTCLDYSTTNRSGSCAHDSTTKFGLTYSYGSSGSNNGQISGITDSVDNGRSVTYTYDSLYRLSTAITTGSSGYTKWGLSWSYDRYGNRTGQSSSYDSPPTNSVTVSATTNRITTSGYGYDANGNMTNDGYNTLVFDGENRETSATNGGSSGTYSYDGNNLRVEKVSGSTTTVYLFSGSKVIAEYDNGAAPSSPSREYLYAGSQLLAKIDSSGTKYYQQDELSNRLVTDSSGNVLAQLGHYPFGESWYNSTGDKLLFTSYERDAESGNDYALARSYVNRLARFSSPDPLSGDPTNPQSLNRYAYVVGDSINLVDPWGLIQLVPPGCIPIYPTPGEAAVDICGGPGGGGGGGHFAPLQNAPSVGGGAGVHNHWGGTFNCKLTAAAVISALEGSFGDFASTVVQFGPVLNVVNFTDTGVLTPGAQVNASVTVEVPGLFSFQPPLANAQLMVASVTPSGFSMNPDPKVSPLNGTLSFSATDAPNGQISFMIAADANYSSAWSRAASFLGKPLESGIWNHLVDNIKKLCGAK